MRRKPIVCLRSVAAVMMLLWTLMLGVNAEEAYTSWDTLNGKVSVYGRDMFEASRRISGTSLGLDFSLKGLEDIFCANDDKVSCVFHEVAHQDIDEQFPGQGSRANGNLVFA